MDLVTGAGRPLLRLRKGGARAEPYGFPAASLVHQPTVEAAIRTVAERHPTVEVRLGHTFEGAAQDEGGVALDVAGPDGPYRARAAWLVGCDGAGRADRPWRCGRRAAWRWPGGRPRARPPTRRRSGRCTRPGRPPRGRRRGCDLRAGWGRGCRGRAAG